MFANNALRLRPRRAWWDLLALREIMARLPGALHYRRTHSQLNREFPGQAFFSATPFMKDGHRAETTVGWVEGRDPRGQGAAWVSSLDPPYPGDGDPTGSRGTARYSSAHSRMKRTWVGRIR